MLLPVPRLVRRVLLIAGAVIFGAAPVVAQQPDPCRIVGRVIDAAGGDGVVGASVWVERAGGPSFLAGAATSSDGAFSLDVGACEAVELRVRMIGYAEASELVRFANAGEIHQTTVRLDRAPLELEELLVEVPRSLRLQDVGFYARKAWEESTGRDLGQFYESDEVVARDAGNLSISGVALNSRIRFLYGGGPPLFCDSLPTFYIDGKKFDRAFNKRDWLDTVRPDELAGMEIYRAVHGAIPDEYRDADSAVCGLVLFWTKAGMGPPQIEVELCEPSSSGGGLTFEGVVTDGLTGLRLGAANVNLVATRRDGTSAELETVTDADGRYRYCNLDALPESIQVGYAGVRGPVQTVPPSILVTKRLHLEVTVARPGTLTGRVVGSDAIPDGMQLTLDGTGLSATPDSLGFFVLGNVPPGDYVVTLTRPGKPVIQREVSIQSGDTTELELDLDG